eukprot:1865656-Alexandrium_andersonii.AAC.1
MCIRDRRCRGGSTQEQAGLQRRQRAPRPSARQSSAESQRSTPEKAGSFPLTLRGAWARGALST